MSRWSAIAAAVLLGLLVTARAARAQPVRGDTAEQAYRAAIEAFNRRIPDYFDAFAERLECFYGREDVPRARVRAMRRGYGSLSVHELRVVRQTESEAVFIDYGTFGAGEEPHEKAVRLRKIAGAWRIVAETGRSRAACMHEVWQGQEPPPRFAACVGVGAACLVGIHTIVPVALTKTRALSTVGDVPWASARYRSEQYGRIGPLRVVQVLYSDVNRDGVQDAVVQTHEPRRHAHAVNAYTVRDGKVVWLSTVGGVSFGPIHRVTIEGGVIAIDRTPCAGDLLGRASSLDEDTEPVDCRRRAVARFVWHRNGFRLTSAPTSAATLRDAVADADESLVPDELWVLSSTNAGFSTERRCGAPARAEATGLLERGRQTGAWSCEAIGSGWFRCRLGPEGFGVGFHGLYAHRAAPSGPVRIVARYFWMPGDDHDPLAAERRRMLTEHCP